MSKPRLGRPRKWAVAGCYQSTSGVVERLSTDSLSADSAGEFFAARLRSGARTYRTEMELGLLALSTLDIICTAVRNFLADSATPPGEKLIATVCLPEIEKEIAQRGKD